MSLLIGLAARRVYGIAKCLSEWIEIKKLKPCTILRRIEKGWDDIKALTAPIKERGALSND
jgi:hypothetical protein